MKDFARFVENQMTLRMISIGAQLREKPMTKKIGDRLLVAGRRRITSETIQFMLTSNPISQARKLETFEPIL